MSHLRPIGGAYEAAEGVRGAAQNRGGARTPEAAAQEVGETGRHEMNHHHVPMQQPVGNVAILERQQETIKRLVGGSA